VGKQENISLVLLISSIHNKNTAFTSIAQKSAFHETNLFLEKMSDPGSLFSGNRGKDFVRCFEILPHDCCLILQHGQQ